MRFLIIPKSRFVALSQLVNIFKSYEITNLSCQFSSRGKHKCQRALLPTSVGLASSALLRSILVNMVQDWNQEGGCFATASLGTGHQISLAQYDRKGVFLRNKSKRTWIRIYTGVSVSVQVRLPRPPSCTDTETATVSVLLLVLYGYRDPYAYRDPPLVRIPRPQCTSEVLKMYLTGLLWFTSFGCVMLTLN